MQQYYLGLPPCLIQFLPAPPPPDFNINAFPFPTPMPLPHAPLYEDVLSVDKEEETNKCFSSPRCLDYSILDNVSTSWRAPTFELAMSKDPHGHHPILVDLFKSTQEVPDNVKKQRPETDDWLYFPPQVVPTTCEIIDGKKKNQSCMVSQ
jgi:hypothetical protein